MCASSALGAWSRRYSEPLTRLEWTPRGPAETQEVGVSPLLLWINIESTLRLGPVPTVYDPRAMSVIVFFGCVEVTYVHTLCVCVCLGVVVTRVAAF